MLDLTMIENATEFPKSEKWNVQPQKLVQKSEVEVPWWQQSFGKLTPDDIQKLMPKSDKQFIGNEYFMG